LAGGRSVNGYTWVEYVAMDVDATLKDYAQSGACIDLSLWPSNPRKVDFIHQDVLEPKQPAGPRNDAI